MAEQVPAPSREVFSITIAGAMNPRIHSPAWYRALGLIDEGELQQATSATSPVIITPLQAHFSIASVPLAITCEPQQWGVQVGSFAVRDRAIDIASLVFERLQDTPVGAFQLMTVVHRQTNKPNVKAVLGAMINSLAVGFPDQQVNAAVIQSTNVQEDYLTTFQIQQSGLIDSFVYVHYSDLYQAPQPPVGITHFDVGAQLRRRYPEHRRRASEFADSVVNGINVRAEAENDAV